jgi:NADP-dependent 3-hydroxy acid dehydrogenase YdfG
VKGVAVVASASSGIGAATVRTAEKGSKDLVAGPRARRIVASLDMSWQTHEEVP